MLRKEKSCGALIWRMSEKKQILLIKHKNGGHWSFPKGHMESNETEQETAVREIYEETGIAAELDMSFRHVVSYSPKEGVMKDVVYFAATYGGGKEKRQEEEVVDIKWLPFDEAEKILTYDSDKVLLDELKKHIC